MSVRAELPPLPIDPLLPELIAALRTNSSLVLEAPPGAGKTTRFPRSLLEEGFADAGEIWVLEPRRLAARMAARRVAWELGEKVGERIGYSVRFDSVSSPNTRLRFVTEGILLRRLTGDPDLNGISTVILDEFHERHLETDVALAILLQLQRTSRFDLKLAVLSATLDTELIASHLGCTSICCEGQAFPVDEEFLPFPNNQTLPGKVAEALNNLFSRDRQGDVLVFLPGVGEIAAVEKACVSLAEGNGCKLLRLHGSLSRDEQDTVVQPSEQRRIILATNVAETSITIEGVTAVIDTGLVKEAGHSPWAGLPSLQTKMTSQASAKQRAGRSGRTKPGLCIRLYTRRDFQSMREFTEPELQRADLSGLLLMLKGSGITDPTDLPWLEPPPKPALEAAAILLNRLGAIDEASVLSSVGKEMLKVSAHPRIARILCEAARRGLRESGALLAAILESPDPRREIRWKGNRDGNSQSKTVHPSDPILIAENLWGKDIDEGGRRNILRIARQYGFKDRETSKVSEQLNEHLKILMSGFPDRVARRVRPNNDEILLCGGGGALLGRESSVRNAEFMTALESRNDTRRGGKIYVTRASAIEPEWLFDLEGAPISESKEVRWNDERECVEVTEQILFEKLVIDSKSSPAVDSEEAVALLTEKAEIAGLERFFDGEALQRLLAKMAIVKEFQPVLDVADELSALELLKNSCRGRSSFRELEEANLLSMLKYSSAPEVITLLDRLTPDEIRLPCGQRLSIHYPPSGQPWAAARIQVFYGMKEGPKIANGCTAVLLHLLAPNNRPAQITDDLAGFWTGSYDLVRKELRGRYPKHHWPNDPSNAEPVQLKKNASG